MAAIELFSYKLNTRVVAPLAHFGTGRQLKNESCKQEGRKEGNWVNLTSLVALVVEGMLCKYCDNARTQERAIGGKIDGGKHALICIKRVKFEESHRSNRRKFATPLDGY